MLTTQHYVNQGGCDLVVYRVTPAGAESGVQAGESWFKGFPLPGARDPAVRFAIFALSLRRAGGDARAPQGSRRGRQRGDGGLQPQGLPASQFRTRTLPIDDAFLGKVVPEILSHTPSLTDEGDLLKNYLAINRGLRAANNKSLAEMAARSQARRPVDASPSSQLGNSKVEASFADHRIYIYKGREVDRQDHLGYDLATTANAPVSASNDGVVLLAEYFGIYGNTVVIDHGYGLLSALRPPGQLRGQGRRHGEERPGHRPERRHGPGRRRPPALLRDPPGRAGGRARSGGTRTGSRTASWPSCASSAPTPRAGPAETASSASPAP